MILLNNILYIEYADFIAAGWKEDAVKKANFRNGPYWMMIADPNDKRKVLVQFDTLRAKDKEKITIFFGNPYEFVAKVPIKKLVLPDPKADLFYSQYRYDGNKVLPFDHQVRYSLAASWLNMLTTVVDDKRIIKKELGISVEKFWQSVCDIIKADKIELPSSYLRLVSCNDSAIKKYKANGYQSLIDWRFGNKQAAKVGKTDEGFSPERYQQQVAVIRKLGRLHMNLDAVQITTIANQLFEKNGWSVLSSSTIANIIAQYMPAIISGKRGQKVYNSTVAMQVQRQRPNYPTYYWTLDGWNVELLYQDGSKYDNRLVMVVVLDAMNNYPVGYAIGDRENTELIRMALRNAIIHMQELFGATYRPWQLQSDRYGVKNLTPFYESITHIYTPAAVGNAKSKVIEPWFNYFNHKHCQLQYNWSGHNINSSKANQPNIEKLNEIKKQLPTKQGVIDQLNNFMLKERLSLVDIYKQQWQAMPVEDQVTLSPEDCLVVFGKAHTELNSITGLGLICTINCQKQVFDSFDPAFRALQFSTRFQVVYDPEDLTNVMAITEDGKQRFMLHNKMKVGMGYKNTTPDQLEYRSKINEFNKQRNEELVQTYLIDDAIVKEVLDNTPLSITNDDELALKLMLTDNYGQQKERLQDAKGLRKIADKAAAAEDAEQQANWQKLQQDYLINKTDINQYL